MTNGIEASNHESYLGVTVERCQLGWQLLCWSCLESWRVETGGRRVQSMFIGIKALAVDALGLLVKTSNATRY
jgi:hypothetical protein